MHFQEVRVVWTYLLHQWTLLCIFFVWRHFMLFMFLLSGGQIFSWGQNQYGQLGLGTNGQSISTPQNIQSLQGIPFAQISTGGAHSFALTLSGAVFGWGRNKFGQLGLNDSNGGRQKLVISEHSLPWLSLIVSIFFSDRSSPALLKSLRSQQVIDISCGEDHTAALTKLSYIHFDHIIIILHIISLLCVEDWFVYVMCDWWWIVVIPSTKRGRNIFIIVFVCLFPQKVEEVF